MTTEQIKQSGNIIARIQQLDKSIAFITKLATMAVTDQVFVTLKLELFNQTRYNNLEQEQLALQQQAMNDQPMPVGIYVMMPGGTAGVGGEEKFSPNEFHKLAENSRRAMQSTWLLETNITESVQISILQAVVDSKKQERQMLEAELKQILYAENTCHD